MSKRKIFLHIGLPKAASSALQFWANECRSYLLSQGVDYPDAPASEFVPKHQDLVAGLMAGSAEPAENYLSNCQSRNLFLSTEGLTNHLYDFPASSRREVQSFFSAWDVVVLMVVRSPSAWVESYWKQCLLNPRVEKFHYGTALSLEEFSGLPRIKRLSSFSQVERDAVDFYGASEVVILNQELDWFAGFCQALGLRDAPSIPSRRHTSVSKDLAEIVRQLNALPLLDRERNAFLALIQHTICSNHQILLSHALSFPVGAIAGMSTSLAGVLPRISPPTLEGRVLLERIRGCLAEVGSLGAD